MGGLEDSLEDHRLVHYDYETGLPPGWSSHYHFWTSSLFMPKGGDPLADTSVPQFHGSDDPNS